jgi:hypothetical protein
LAHHLSLFPPFLLIGANLRKPPTYVDNFDCADVKPLQQQICLRAQFFSCKKLICKLRENNISWVYGGKRICPAVKFGAKKRRFFLRLNLALKSDALSWSMWSCTKQILHQNSTC